MRILPPGRGSTSAFGLVQPCGPHHVARCFAAVHMLNTSARGASNVRVMVISRCATGLAAALAAAVMDFAPFVRRSLLGSGFHVCEPGGEIAADHFVDIHSMRRRTARSRIDIRPGKNA